MNASFVCWARVALLAAAAVMAGCAQVPMGPPVASIDNIQKARAAGIEPVALGTFQLAPGKNASIDLSVSVRSNRVYSPYGNSFAQYLRMTLQTDLAAAGLLDPASGLVLEGDLLESELDVPAGAASAVVAARFRLRKQGATLYDKTHRATHAWKAPFIGVEAIPGGINEYGLLYRKLVTMLLDDPEFRAAASPPRGRTQVIGQM